MGAYKDAKKFASKYPFVALVVGSLAAVQAYRIYMGAVFATRFVEENA